MSLNRCLCRKIIRIILAYVRKILYLCTQKVVINQVTAKIGDFSLTSNFKTKKNMKVTKDDIQQLEVGQTRIFNLEPLEMFSARSYIYQLAMVTGKQYRTKYDRKTRDFAVTRQQ